MTVEHSATYVLYMELHLSPLPLERVHLLACYDRLLERILSPHSKSHTIPIFGEIMIDPLIHWSVVTQRLPNPSFMSGAYERGPNSPASKARTKCCARNKRTGTTAKVVDSVDWLKSTAMFVIAKSTEGRMAGTQLSSRIKSSTESCSGSQRWNWLNTGTGRTEALKRAACMATGSVPTQWRLIGSGRKASVMARLFRKRRSIPLEGSTSEWRYLSMPRR